MGRGRGSSRSDSSSSHKGTRKRETRRRSRSKERDNGRSRRERTPNSEERRREQRKKQENLAKLRALQIEEELRRERMAELKNNANTNQVVNHPQHQVTSFARTLTSKMGSNGERYEQSCDAEEYYEPVHTLDKRDVQPDGWRSTLEDEDGQLRGIERILTEEEIIQANRAFAERRELLKKKSESNGADQRNQVMRKLMRMNSDVSSSEEDAIPFFKSKAMPKPVKQDFQIGNFNIQNGAALVAPPPPDDNEDIPPPPLPMDEEIVPPPLPDDIPLPPSMPQPPFNNEKTVTGESSKWDEEKIIEEAMTNGEDPLEAYLRTIIEPQAPKFEAPVLNLKSKMHEEDLDVTQDGHLKEDLVANFDEIARLAQLGENKATSSMDQETIDGPDGDDLEFIQALKNHDRIFSKDTDEEPQIEAPPKEEELLSSNDSSVFDEDDESYDNPENDADYFTRQDKKVQKKTLKPVDHAQIVYEPFRKNLYIESEEIGLMSEDDIEYFRKELGDIKIRGLECPRPIRTWYHCGLSDEILKVLVDKNKFKHPFPIQSQAIPVVMSGRDCIGIAETGSGKTLAYVLPMIRHIKDQRPILEGEGPIALVMVPTHELAAQVHNETKSLAKAVGINVVCVYGGTQVTGQLSDLKKGAEVVICTPGRMIDVLTLSNGKITNLNRVTFVVIDEADRMFDMGFGPQIGKIIANVRPDRQTVMFSATFPKNVEGLARKLIQNRPIEIVVGNRGQVGKNILQIIEVIEPEKKKTRLLELLGYWNTKGQILIFSHKQTECDQLFVDLQACGYQTLVLHGGNDNIDRHSAISDFKKGTKNILIATSVAARGLDIKNLVLVINYNCPTHKEDYTHRIGRTGRAGNKGTAITFITPDEDKYAGDLIHALELSNVDPPEDLKRLHERFMVKVRRGEAREDRNRNMAGSGYRFNADELTKTVEFKNAFKTQFGFDLANDDNISMTSRMSKSLTSFQGSTTGGDEKKGPKEGGFGRESKKVFKDPKVREAIRKAATRAATQAINAGGSGEEAIHAAMSAIRDIVQRLQMGEVIGRETDAAALLRAREEMLDKATASSGFTEKFEINDYPDSTRRKVADKEYLEEVGSLTNCKLTLRGVHIETGRKALIGQSKLHVLIESDEEANLRLARDELKRFCEADAINGLSIGGTGYTGFT